MPAAFSAVIRTEKPYDMERVARAVSAELGNVAAVACYAMVVRGPADLPSEYAGQPVLAIIACYSGAVAEGLRGLDPVGSFATPIAATIEGTPYRAMQQMFDPGSWEVALLYQDVEKDAQWGGVIDSDFAGGATQGKGWLLRGGCARAYASRQVTSSRFAR